MSKLNRLKIFLGYAHHDVVPVRKLYKYLCGKGFDVWFDEASLLPGQNWEFEIEKALRQSDIAIISLTTNSINKEGFIQKEIKFALDKSMDIPEGKIFLIPARLDDCIVPETLARFHWVDLFEENGYESLLKSLVARSDQVNAISETKMQYQHNIDLDNTTSKIIDKIDSDSIYAEYKKIFAENSGILRASTAIALGIPKHVIYAMVESGDLVRETQGIYRLKEIEPLGNPDLVQIALRVPRAVICLISALYFYDLTTQIPYKVYVALPRDVKTPKIEYPPIWTFHFSSESYHAGIETQIVDGVKVQIYNREKTIADCFKFRQKVGMDVTLEAIKDYLKQPRPNVSLLLKYARRNRVEKIMRPYLEALI
jgi:predicted transcriptional regulator of viral defense system